MKVLLVSANTERINMPVLPLGMSCVARAVEDAEHEVRQINLMAKSDTLNSLTHLFGHFDPDVIGISVRNIDDQVSDNASFLLEPVKAIVDACRANSNAGIVLGGAGYSIFPGLRWNIWVPTWVFKVRDKVISPHRVGIEETLHDNRPTLKGKQRIFQQVS